MNALDFSGKVFLVVGGSSGIGNGIARACRDHGAIVYVWGTRVRAEDYAGEEGSDLTGLHYAQMNVTDFAAIAAYQPPFTRIDTLVLSQGAVIYGRGEFDMKGFEHVMDVNLHSLMACALKFENLLADSKGSIIIISSTGAFHSTRGNPAYNASKAGAVGLTRTLGDAWIRKGIRVNGVAPGLVGTKMTKITTEDPKRLDARLRGIPIGRLGTPADVAGPVLFLASPLASYIVGQTLIVDGGKMLPSA